MPTEFQEKLSGILKRPKTPYTDLEVLCACVEELESKGQTALLYAYFANIFDDMATKQLLQQIKNKPIS